MSRPVIIFAAAAAAVILAFVAGPNSNKSTSSDNGTAEVRAPGDANVVNLKPVATGTHGTAKAGEVAPPAVNSSPAMPSADQLMEMLYHLSESRHPSGMEEMLVQWMATDPDAVAAFLSSSPERDLLLHRITALWAKADPGAASAWLASRPAVDGHDAMAAGLAAGVAKEDLQAAVLWVASIKDPVMKLAAASATGYEFYRQGDAVAGEALAGMGLPPSARETVVSAWRARLDAISRRNAQNLASSYHASKAAGAVIEGSTVEQIRTIIAAGVKGSGQFSDMTFKVDSKDLTERELTAAGTHLELLDGDLNYIAN